MILIILPVKNESKTIDKTIHDLWQWCQVHLKNDYKILFIDDGSTDETIKKISSSNFPNIAVEKNEFDRGKGSALKAGFIISRYTYKMSAEDIIIFMDGDGQIEPAEIKTFLNVMDFYQADIVIGNKYHTYSIIHYTPVRRIISFFYNLIIRTLFGFSFQDTQCGIKLFRKNALDRVVSKITVKKFAFDLELIVALREMSLRVADAPVKIKEQLNAGCISFINIMQTFIDTIKVWNRMRKGFYKNG